jgi:hypothetical protein
VTNGCLSHLDDHDRGVLVTVVPLLKTPALQLKLTVISQIYCSSCPIDGAVAVTRNLVCHLEVCRNSFGQFFCLLIFSVLYTTRAIASCSLRKLDSDSVTTTLVWYPCHLLAHTYYYCDGLTGCVVRSLPLWTIIFFTSGILIPQARLQRNEETAFWRSRKGQRGLAS